LATSIPAWCLEPNVIRWTTASEENNFGYDVYRGSTEEGPFERINADPLPGAGTTDIPQHYEYQDSAIEAGTVYWYYVEAISMNGDRKRMTPIYPSKAKFEHEP
jgi:hypothetical protein